MVPVLMIRYHGTPMTPLADMLRALKGKHAMVSFENPEQIEEVCEICQAVVLDCGAYSAWRKGERHDYAGYLEWCRFWLKHPCVQWCIIPDVIDGTEEENDALIDEWPLPAAVSVPVFHMHESLNRLRRLMQRFPRIAIGSSGEYAEIGTSKWWNRMAEIMEVLCDADGMPLVMIHGLRMLDTGIFSRLPLSSADSCNVARNIGLDTRWRGTYTPRRKVTRMIVLIHNIEDHVAAHRWNGDGAGFQQNMELLG